MIWSQIFIKHYFAGYCQKQWIDTPNGGYQPNIYLSSCWIVHSKNYQILHKKVYPAKSDETEKIDLTQLAVDD